MKDFFSRNFYSFALSAAAQLIVTLGFVLFLKFHDVQPNENSQGGHYFAIWILAGLVSGVLCLKKVEAVGLNRLLVVILFIPLSVGYLLFLFQSLGTLFDVFEGF